MTAVFEKIDALQEHLNSKTEQGCTVGFVPTMGALHEGHLSLIRKSKLQNDLTVCSVFVNPNQFNDPNDLKNYPRDFDKDLHLLKQEGCDVVFHPNVEEMYPEPTTETYHFGSLETVMEGAHRPGHFNGVAVVVRRLFDIVKPNRAYFGLKDYQQLVIIHKMTKDLGLPIEIIPCDIVREENGLAMSSRNALLSRDERNQAAIIYETLKYVKDHFPQTTLSDIKNYVGYRFDEEQNFQLEYFEIVDLYSLTPLKSWTESKQIIGCIAVRVGKVRLIDNIIIIS